MNNLKKFTRSVTALALLVAIATGCSEVLSWSPDGRYLVFIGEDREALWQWDSETGDLKETFKHEKITACRYLSDDGRVLVGVGDDPLDLREVNVHTGAERPLVSAVQALGYDAMAAGDRLYCIRNRRDLLMQRLVEPGGQRTLMSFDKDVGHLAVRADREQALAVAEEGNAIQVIDLEIGVVLKSISPGDNQYWLPRWLDDSTVLCIETREGGDDDDARLLRVTLDDGTAEVLYDGMYAPSMYSLAPDGKSVALTVVRPVEDPRPDDPRRLQLAIVNLDTAQADVLTNDPLGALWPSFRPDGRRVAYRSYPDVPLKVTVFDIVEGTARVIAGQGSDDS